MVLNKYLTEYHTTKYTEVLIRMVAGTKYKVIGKSPIRHDGYDKVTGKAKYGADIHPPGLLHGKILRSPYAHARILSIDTADGLARCSSSTSESPIVFK